MWLEPINDADPHSLVSPSSCELEFKPCTPTVLGASGDECAADCCPLDSAACSLLLCVPR